MANLNTLYNDQNEVEEISGYLGEYENHSEHSDEEQSWSQQIFSEVLNRDYPDEMN